MAVSRGLASPSHLLQAAFARLHLLCGLLFLPRRIGPAEWRYASPALEFSLSVLRLESGVRWESPKKRGVELLLCTGGDVVLCDARGRALELPMGACAIAPSAAGSYRAEGPGVVHRATVGLDFS